MPALRKVAPVILKEIMEAAEWSVYTEDRWNWSLVNSEGLSLEIPKCGRLVSFQVMDNALAQADLRPADYFRLLGDCRRGSTRTGSSARRNRSPPTSPLTPSARICLRSLCYQRIGIHY